MYLGRIVEFAGTDELSRQVARELCSAEAPGLEEQDSASHLAACHFPVRSAEDLLAADTSNDR